MTLLTVAVGVSPGRSRSEIAFDTPSGDRLATLGGLEGRTALLKKVGLTMNLHDATGADRTERVVSVLLELAAGTLGRQQRHTGAFPGVTKLFGYDVVDVDAQPQPRMRDFGETHVLVLACGEAARKRLCAPRGGKGWQPLYDRRRCTCSHDVSVLPLPHLTRARIWKEAAATELLAARVAVFFESMGGVDRRLVAWTLGNLIGVGAAQRRVRFLDLFDHRHRLAEAWLRASGPGDLPAWMTKPEARRDDA